MGILHYPAYNTLGALCKTPMHIHQCNTTNPQLVTCKRCLKSLEKMQKEFDKLQAKF